MNRKILREQLGVLKEKVRRGADWVRPEIMVDILEAILEGGDIKESKKPKKRV